MPNSQKFLLDKAKESAKELFEIDYPCDNGQYSEEKDILNIYEHYFLYKELLLIIQSELKNELRSLNISLDSSINNDICTNPQVFIDAIQIARHNIFRRNGNGRNN